MGRDAWVRGKPFVQNLVENVSAHLTIVNQGWVVSHPDVVKASRRKVPILLGHTAMDGGAADALSKLASQFLGSKSKAPVRQKADTASYLEAQLDTLTRMQHGMAHASYEDNFKYIVLRSLHVMAKIGRAHV